MAERTWRILRSVLLTGAGAALTSSVLTITGTAEDAASTVRIDVAGEHFEVELRNPAVVLGPGHDRGKAALGLGSGLGGASRHQQEPGRLLEHSHVLGLEVVQGPQLPPCHQPGPAHLAQACCDANKEAMERMFQRSMSK